MSQRYIFEVIRARPREAFRFAESLRLAVIMGLILYWHLVFILPLYYEQEY